MIVFSYKINICFPSVKRKKKCEIVTKSFNNLENTNFLYELY